MFSLLNLPALIVLSFAAGKSKLDFGYPALVKINPQRNKSKTSLVEFGRYLTDLCLVKQKFPSPHRLVIDRPGLGVLGYLTANQPALALVYPPVRALEVGLELTKAFDFGADQRNPRLDLLYKLIISPGLFIGYL